MYFAAGVDQSEVQNPITPPPLHTVYLFTQGKGGGESLTREKGRGAIVHKARSKISTFLTASPVYKLW